MKIIITEEQYRLIKENDESFYETIADLLMNKDASNKEIGLYLIKSQNLNVDIISKIIVKRQIPSIETIDLRTRRRNVFFSLNLSISAISGQVSYRYDGKPILFSKILNTFKDRYDDNFDLENEEDKYFIFLNKFMENLIFMTANTLQKTIDILPEEL